MNGGIGNFSMKINLESEDIAKTAAAAETAVRYAAALESVLFIMRAVFFSADKHSFSRSKGSVAEAMAVMMVMMVVTIIMMFVVSVIAMFVTTSKKHIYTPFVVHYIIHKTGNSVTKKWQILLYFSLCNWCKCTKKSF